MICVRTRLLLVFAMTAILCGCNPASRGTPRRAPADLPDIETFMQIGAASNPALSRDGRRLFFVSSVSGTLQLYRLTEKGEPYQLTSFPDGFSGSSRLSNDERAIAVTAAAAGSERYQIYLVSADTGQTRQITAESGSRFGVPAFSPDDRRIYFTGNADSPADFYIYASDLDDGAECPGRRLLYKRDGFNSIYDISRDGKKLLVSHTTVSADNDLYTVDTATGEERPLTPHEGSALFTAGAFSARDDLVYVITDLNSDGVRRIATVSGSPPRLTYLFPDDHAPWSAEALALSQDGRYLAWTVNEDGWGRLRLWDTEKACAIATPTLDGLVTDPYLSANGRLAFGFNRPVRTSDVWTWEFESREGWGRRGEPGRLRQWTFSSYKGIDPAWFTAPSLIRYESFDGTVIPAFLYRPPGEAAGPVPFIIDVHGGPEGQARPFFNRHYQFLLLHGYGILAPNVRGSTGYGRAYMEADDYTKRMNAVKDIAWAARCLIDQGLTSPARMGIKGTSYGGYMTLAAMTEFPELFAAGVDEVGISNFETFLARTAAYRRELRASEYGPATDVKFLKSISPIHKVDRIRSPILVVHGENDPRVPVGEARQILHALVARGLPADSLIFPDEGHGVRKLANRLVLYRRMVDFFERNLKK